MRHIILEGPDGAGKTHLARKLCAMNQMGYHHEGPPPVGIPPLHHYAALLTQAARPTVFDRLHLGQVVYPPLLRDELPMTPTELTLMARLISGTGSFVIGCLPPWAVCLANNRAKEELIKDEGVLYAAYAEWQLMFRFRENMPSLLNYEVYDYTRSGGLGVNMNPHQFKRCPDGVIGSPSARILFIGEQPNSKTLDLPFFGTARSSGYLFERIEEAELDEEDMAFTNALDVRGNARDLAFIVSQMSDLNVVVPLGRVAENQIERQNVPFVKIHPIPHPQYWKRFHASEPEAYTAKLKELHHVS